MKNLIFFAVTLIFTSMACKDEDDLPTLPTDATFDERVEQIFQPMVDQETTVGVAVGLMKPGGIKETYFFGEKTKGQDNPPDAETLFEIGSITKTMTAAVLAQMVKDGDLKLDDAVEDYLPEINDFPSHGGEKITFQHLANHTSSLPRLPDNIDGENFDPDQPYLNYTKEMMFEFLDGYTLSRPIGSEEEYSNLGMGLLGYTLAKIKGIPLEELFQRIVFKRVGMTDACSEIPAGHQNTSQPYNEHLNPVPAWKMSETTLGTGGVKATLGDMMAYLEANLERGPSDLIDILRFTHQNTQTLNGRFGVGLAWNNIESAEDGTTLTWHNGGTGGTVSCIGFVKELDMGFVLLFNTEIAERTGENLIELFKGIELIQLMKEN